MPNEPPLYCDVAECNGRPYLAIRGMFDPLRRYCILHYGNAISTSDSPPPNATRVTPTEWICYVLGKEVSTSLAVKHIHDYLDGKCIDELPAPIRSVCRRIYARLAAPKPGFWLVWGEGTHTVTRQHETHDSAIAESRRLAKANPGQSFYVVGATEVARCGVTEVRQVTGINTTADIIPF